MTDRKNTKYGDQLEGHDWSDPEPDEPERETTVTHHELAVISDNEPDPDDNYGRTKYTVRIHNERDGDGRYVPLVAAHRWKGNYWRDVTDLDWRDVPERVRRAVCDAVGVEFPDVLDSGQRLIEEGGEGRFEKYHKPRMDAMDGGDMWGRSYLTDAVAALEGAAESVNDDLAEQQLEALIEDTRTVAESLGESDADP